MALGLLQSVISVVSTCSKRVSRAAKKKLQAHAVSPGRSDNARANGNNSKRKLMQWKRRDAGHRRRLSHEEVEEEVDGVDDDGGVWRRAILLGEKCQPPDFSGVIYYDGEGRRLPEFPTTPRSPMRSPLPSFAGKVPIIIKGDTGGSY